MFVGENRDLQKNILIFQLKGFIRALPLINLELPVWIWKRKKHKFRKKKKNHRNRKQRLKLVRCGEWILLTTSWEVLDISRNLPSQLQLSASILLCLHVCLRRLPSLSATFAPAAILASGCLIFVYINSIIEPKNDFNSKFVVTRLHLQ